MALRFLEELLRQELARLGREDVFRRCVGHIAFTDDGSTIYVHLFPKAGGAKRRGRVYVLAWHDYAPAPHHRLDCFRWLVQEAKLNIRYHAQDIARWLEGK